MADVTSPIHICNLALSNLGNTGSVNSIETPTSDLEVYCALWYDLSRRLALKKAQPNFALSRRRVALVDEEAPYPFDYVYEYPSDCLKVLGIGAVEDKTNNYTVEGNRIYTSVEYTDGMPIRFIRDVEDVATFSPEFVDFLALVLASKIALPVTQDAAKAAALKQYIPIDLSEVSGLNAQENMPIRKSISKFMESRITGYATR